MAAAEVATSGDTGGGGTDCTNGSGTVGTAGGTVTHAERPHGRRPRGRPSREHRHHGRGFDRHRSGRRGLLALPVRPRWDDLHDACDGELPGTGRHDGPPTSPSTGPSREARREWDVLPATVSGTTATASVTHFSMGFVGAACAAGAACTPANACHIGVTTCNGTPACADTGTPVDGRNRLVGRASPARPGPALDLRARRARPARRPGPPTPARPTRRPATRAASSPAALRETSPTAPPAAADSRARSGPAPARPAPPARPARRPGAPTPARPTRRRVTRAASNLVGPPETSPMGRLAEPDSSARRVPAARSPQPRTTFPWPSRGAMS